MGKPLSLRKNFSWTFAGNVVNAASLWGIIALATKLGGPVMVGRLELSRAIAAPLLVVVMLQLRAVQVTDAKGEYLFADYFGTRLIMSVLGIFAFLIIARGWYSGEAAWVILLWGLAKSIDSVSDIIRGLFQRHEQMNLSGISFMIKGPASLAVMGGLLWLTGKLAVAVGGVIFAYILVLFLYDLPQARHLLSDRYISDEIKRRLLPQFNVRTILRLLLLALPLGVVMLLVALQSSVPRLILESYHGEAALGYFGPIAYPIMAGTIIISAMGQSASPRLANYYVSNLTAYRHLMRKLLLLAAGMGVVFVGAVVLFGKFVLRLLYTAKYADYNTEFIILSVGGAIMFVHFFCGCGLTSARAFKVQLVMAVISCSVAAAAAFLLIPSYGVRGTAITSLVTCITMFACSFSTLLWIIHRRRRELSARGI